MHSGYFYDGQVRRFLTQFIRLLSNFYVEYNTDGIKSLKRVPVIYGDGTKQALSIIKNNSENYLNSVPAMSAYIAAMRYDRNRVQNPSFVSKLHLTQRAVDPLTGAYTTQPGDAVTVERMMPVPYTLTIKLDIWTSNTEQKLQLLEQICSIFNPAVEVQSTDNYIDWSSLSYVLLTDTGFTNRSVPVGTADSIDVSTLTFEVPIWISPPAIIKRQGIIHKIITSIYDINGDINDAVLEDSNLFTRSYYTPLDYGIIVTKINTSDSSNPQAEIQLVKYSSPTTDPLGINIWKRVTANATSNTTVTLSSGFDVKSGMISNIGGILTTVVSVNDNVVTLNKFVNVSIDDRITFTALPEKIGESHNWRDLTVLYGNLVSGSTRIKFEIDTENTLVGTVAYHPNNNNVLLWTADIDTIPQPTLNPVNAIIDPRRARPNKELPSPTQGTRYLLAYDYNVDTEGFSDQEFAYNWLGIDGTRIAARASDIIQYTGTHWVVSFDSTGTDSVEYAVNLNTNMHYRFFNGKWSKTYEGVYKGGQWQLII
jgi:hypothetical protein